MNKAINANGLLRYFFQYLIHRHRPPVLIKGLIIMKLCLLYLIVFCACCFAEVNAQKININVKTASFMEVAKLIHRETGYSISISNRFLEEAKPVTLHMKNEELDIVLEELFRNQPFDYQRIGRTVVVKDKPSLRRSVGKKMDLYSASQNQIRGKVTNENGEPLIGASIYLLDERGNMTSVQTKTDEWGSFSFSDVANGSSLEVTFMGYNTVKVTVDKSEITVVLKLLTSDLDEVVVVGFGAQKKASVIGAISTVSVNDLKTPVSKLSTALAGQAAGVVTVQRSGEPGAGSNFWIRGISTFGANNRPLVLVDGVERSLDLVDPEDIESFSILKDATATAVFGIRGANGVILINTKRGKFENTPEIIAKYEKGLLSPTKMVELANAEQWIDYYNDINVAESGDTPFPKEIKDLYLNKTDLDLYPNVDWIDEIFKSSTSNERLNLSVSGGSKTLKYYVAGSLINESGLFKPVSTPNYNPQFEYKKYNFRSNIDLNISKTATLSLSLANQYENRNRLGIDLQSMYRALIMTPPISIPPQYSDGTLAMPLVGHNPYYSLNHTGFSEDFWNNSQSLLSFTNDFSHIVKGLTANVKFSWDAVNSSTIDKRKNPTTYFATGRDKDGQLEFHKNTDGRDYLNLAKSNSGSRTMYFESSLGYNQEFFGKHLVSGLMLFNFREHTNSFPSDFIAAFPFRNIGIASRLTYSYFNKYFLEGNFGYNGSENFAPGKRFGFFPSLAVGYIISNESFLKDASYLDLLKIRGSFGEIGNDQIGGNRRFAYNSEMTTSTGYQFGYSGQKVLQGIATGHPGNPNVSWERAIKRNIGVELGFLSSIKLQGDYFFEKRDGIYILQESVPSVVGLNVKQYVNSGKMQNQGFDGNIEFYKNYNALFVQFRLNYTYNTNKVLYDDKPTPTWAYQSGIGKRLGQQMGLVSLGLFESADDILSSPKQLFGNVDPGDIKYKDINGDGVVDALDQIPIGFSNVPEHNYGFGFSLRYKGFDISSFFHGVSNVTRIIGGRALRGPDGNILVEGQIFSDVADNRWTQQNPDPNAKYPRLSLVYNQNNRMNTTFYQQDMSFLRIKNAEIGYTFKGTYFDSIKIKGVRIYVQGVNLLTFSKFKLWDPELGTDTGEVYPYMRVLNLGLNVNF